MSNPWTKKNPLMSLWLSSANKVMGATRAQVTAAAKREVAATQSDVQKHVVAFWSGKSVRPAAGKKPRR